MMNTFRKMIGKPVVFEATIFLKGGQVIVLKVTELKTERNGDNSLSSVSWKLADESAKDSLSAPQRHLVHPHQGTLIMSNIRQTLEELKVPFTTEFVLDTFHGQRYIFERKYFKKVEKAMPGYARPHNKQFAITIY